MKYLERNRMRQKGHFHIDLGNNSQIETVAGVGRAKTKSEGLLPVLNVAAVV